MEGRQAAALLLLAALVALPIVVAVQPGAPTHALRFPVSATSAGSGYSQGPVPSGGVDWRDTFEAPANLSRLRLEATATPRAGTAATGMVARVEFVSPNGTRYVGEWSGPAAFTIRYEVDLAPVPPESLVRASGVEEAARHLPPRSDAGAGTWQVSVSMSPAHGPAGWFGAQVKIVEESWTGEVVPLG